MSLSFQGAPGRHERALQRRHHNPLFGTPPPQISPEQLREARRRDQDEAIAFQQRFRSLVGQAAGLGPNEPSDRILALKEALEQAYEEAVGLGGDLEASKSALRTLIEVIMRAIWRGAGADPLAHQELDREETARQLHFELLQEPLVADLLHPQGPIAPEDLVPTLLSASAGALEAALQLFDADQIHLLAQAGQRLLQSLTERGFTLPEAWERLGQMQDRRPREV